MPRRASASSRRGRGSHAIQREDGRARIAVGTDGWTLPIPLVRSRSGWSFDTEAGLEEMRIRRIGRNERCRGADDAGDPRRAARLRQRAPRSAMGCITYASKLASSPGKHDGLYWPTQAGEPPSPLGPAVASAGRAQPSPDGYYGYHYKMLTSQGPHAPAARSTISCDGKLFGGFAVIAWPARYRDTGVMSFIVSHDGQVYETRPRRRHRGEGRGDEVLRPRPGLEHRYRHEAVASSRVLRHRAGAVGLRLLRGTRRNGGAGGLLP